MLSLIVMPILAGAKIGVGNALKDNLILADAARTRICVLLSISTLLGVGLFQISGAAWLDPVAGFVIAAFAIHVSFATVMGPSGSPAGRDHLFGSGGMSWRRWVSCQLRVSGVGGRTGLRRRVRVPWR